MYDDCGGGEVKVAFLGVVGCLVKCCMWYGYVFAVFASLVCGYVGVVDVDIFGVDTGDDEPVVDVFLVDGLEVEENEWWNAVL